MDYSTNSIQVLPEVRVISWSLKSLKAPTTQERQKSLKSVKAPTSQERNSSKDSSSKPRDNPPETTLAEAEGSPRREELKSNSCMRRHLEKATDEAAEEAAYSIFPVHTRSRRRIVMSISAQLGGIA